MRPRQRSGFSGQRLSSRVSLTQLGAAAMSRNRKSANSPRQRLHVRVTSLEHGGETRRFFLPTPARAGFFEAPMHAHLHQGLFAVQFLFEPPQCLVDRLAFFEMYFGHIPGLLPHGFMSSAERAEGNS